MMEREGRVFKERKVIYFLYFLYICCFLGLLLFGPEREPGAGKNDVALYICLSILIVAAVPLYLRLRHPIRLIINSDGIHYHSRDFTLADGSTCWHDSQVFYPWEEMTGFYFFWESTRTPFYYNVFLALNNTRHEYADFIKINNLRATRKSVARAIETYSRGACKLDREKMAVSLRKRRNDYWITIAMLLVVTAAIVLIGKCTGAT